MKKSHMLVRLVLAIALILSSTHSIARAESLYTLSGSIVTNDGTPLANVRVFAQRIGSSGMNPHTCTDVNGYYSMMVTPSIYRINLAADSIETLSPCESQYTPPQGSHAPRDRLVIGGISKLYQEVMISTNDVVKNFKIPTVKLTIRALDTNDSPIINRDAYANTSEVYESSLIEGGSPIVPTGSSYLRAHKTDSNGEVSGYIVAGGVFLPGSVCVNIVVQTICNQSTVTISENTTIVLQARPSAPVSLSIPGPTQTPSLAWNIVTGAERYNIYANNILVGSSVMNFYTDSIANEGNVNYYVTAVNAGGESGPSNIVGVMVDRTNPIITHTANPTANEYGWNNENVTVSFECNDGLSGVKTCSEPVTLTAENSSQIVSGSATDHAGNSSLTSTIVSIDKSAPTLATPSWSGGSIQQGKTTTLSISAVDVLSGIKSVRYAVNGGAMHDMSFDTISNMWRISLGGTLPVGSHIVTITGEDYAGNMTQRTTTLTVTKQTTTTPSFFSIVISLLALLVKALVSIMMKLF